MNVVDSSGWLEYFANGPNASFFAPGVEGIDELIVPTITIFEVFKRILQQRSENEALQAAAAMQQGMVADLDSRIAVAAARISLDHKLPMADSIVLASARAYGAVLWTQDVDFKGLPGVRYRMKRE
ncbi:MAG: type II toxin-antitoxin system VapC family toxin [Acidobacteria bacterium]|nr:type II toxin-antitoxin system VapC family toxin [Acidobacteriota bacterium]